MATTPRSESRPGSPSGSNDFAAWNEEMVERYDIDEYYERAHPIVRRVEAVRLSTLLRLAAHRQGERVLEVGCGAGHVLERFAGATRTGVDISPAMLVRTRRRLEASVTLARASADCLPFATGAFDVVVCTEVLEHTPDPGAVIGELMRVARQAGRVVVSIPNEALIDRAKRILHAIPGLRGWLRTLAAENNEWHLHRFDLKLLRRVTAGRAKIRKLVPVPSRIFPLRYVALLDYGPVQDRRSV